MLTALRRTLPTRNFIHTSFIHLLCSLSFAEHCQQETSFIHFLRSLRLAERCQQETSFIPHSYISCIHLASRNAANKKHHSTLPGPANEKHPSHTYTHPALHNICHKYNYSLLRINRTYRTQHTSMTLPTSCFTACYSTGTMFRPRYITCASQTPLLNIPAALRRTPPLRHPHTSQHTADKDNFTLNHDITQYPEYQWQRVRRHSFTIYFSRLHLTIYCCHHMQQSCVLQSSHVLSEILYDHQVIAILGPDPTAFNFQCPLSTDICSALFSSSSIHRLHLCFNLVFSPATVASSAVLHVKLTTPPAVLAIYTSSLCSNFHKNAFLPHSSRFTEYCREDQHLTRLWCVSDTALTKRSIFHHSQTYIISHSTHNAVYSLNLTRIIPPQMIHNFNY